MLQSPEKQAWYQLGRKFRVLQYGARHLEESVGAEHLEAYFGDLLEEGSMRGRLRRAGLRVDFD